MPIRSQSGYLAGIITLFCAEFGIAEMLSDIKSADPRAEVVLIGGDDEEGVEAVKAGAYACLKVPIDMKRLGAIVADADLYGRDAQRFGPP